MASSIYRDPKQFSELMRMTDPRFHGPSHFSPTPAEVRQTSRAYAKEIFDSWTALHEILVRREDVIRKRWMKKNKEQRSRILLTAWPQMPLRHRPDLLELARRKTLSRPANHAAFLWPYINLEDLLQGKSLLLFLNSRGRNPPHVFAHTDLEASHMGRASKVILPLTLRKHTMYIAGQTKQQKYGRLVSWDDDINAEIDSCLQFKPGDGLLILEIQSKIYNFLLECCYQMFQDIPRDKLASLEIPELPEPAPIVSNETSYAQLASVAAEAPYRVPADLDPHQLFILVEARRAAAEDHIWDMREDPGYFALALVELAQHRPEIMLDTNGHRHPHHNDDLFWNRIIGDMLNEAYIGFVSWHALSNAVAAVEKYSPVIKTLNRRRPLPSNLQTALLDLGYAAKNIVEALTHILICGIPSSPPMRKHFLRYPQEPGTTTLKTKTLESAEHDPLLKVLEKLWDEKQVRLAGLPTIVDEIQRFVDHHPVQKERMSTWIVQHFADLAICARVIREVNAFFPWAAGFDIKLTDSERAKTSDKAMKDGEIVMHGTHDLAPELMQLVLPLQEKFDYPMDQAYNAANVDAMRRAEANLDGFWKRLDDFYAKEFGVTLQQVLYRHSVSPRQIQRTPPWAPACMSPSDLPSSGPTAQEIIEAGLSLLDLGREQPARFTTEPPRAKVKTQGTSQQMSSKNNGTDKQASTAPATFTLGRRAWKVFFTMFHNPGESEQAAEIPWPDFLHAMTATGFATKKLYGSAWQFTPLTADVEDAIYIHEPHPAGKITFHTARRLGRRLFRTYGWTVDTFKLA